MSQLGQGGFGSGSEWQMDRNAAFPDVFCDYASLSLPQTILYAMRWCFLPGTMIERNDFNIVPIESIRPGDKVRTKLNTIESVVGCSARPVDEDIVSIVVSSLGETIPLKLTGNHKIPVRDPNTGEETVKLAKDIIKGDYLYCPRLKLGDKKPAADGCGEYAQTKKFNNTIKEYSADYILSVIAGWLDGDGGLSIDNDKFSAFSGYTTSSVLAFQLLQLANACGLRPELIRQPLSHGYEHNEYILRFDKEDCLLLMQYSSKLQTYRDTGGSIVCGPSKQCILLDNEYVYRKVTSVTTERYVGNVYNFEVENEHSYIANGCASLNCEYIFFSNGTYARAIDRIVAYFITELEVKSTEEDSLDDGKKAEILSYLYDEVDILDKLHQIALNYLIYGNEFLSVVTPFKRYLSCKQCHIELPLKQVYENDQFKFQWSEFDFHAVCPRCKYSGAWTHIDRRAGPGAELVIKSWSPHEIELLWDPYTNNTIQIWKIPEDYRKCIREGHLHHLERAPWEVIQAIKENKHLQFDKDFVLHLREVTPAGMRDRGWGISRVLTNFRQAWYVQMLYRYNEAIALDYIIPFRVITPAPGPGSGDQAKDTLLNMNMGGYMGRINRMLRERRKDPAGWHTLPFPIEYKALGGDASQLAPKDLLDQGVETLLSNIGVPVELYKGSMTLQSAPAALRMFESQWSHLVHILNNALAFILKKVSMIHSWDSVTAKLMRVTHADDMNRQMQKLQLMMGGQISKETGLKPLGVEYREEVKRQMDEQAFEAEQQNKAQEKMQQASTMDQMAQPPQPGGQPGQPGGQPGQPQGDPSQQGGGGQPQAGGAYGQAMAAMPTIPTKPTTPQEFMAKAQDVAQKLMSLPDGQRKSELIALKKSDPYLHPLVLAQIKEIQQKAKTQGGAMLLAQNQKQGSVSKWPRYIDLE